METRAASEKEAEFLSRKIQDDVNISCAHFISFYDSFRLFGRGLSHLGVGTSQCSARVIVSGDDWTSALPAGQGEPSVLRHREAEKAKRALVRKNAALGALERERLRRDADSEEARLKREARLADTQGAFDDEEQVSCLFSSCKFSGV